MAIVREGISTINSLVQYVELKSVIDQNKRIELFHVMVIVKHTKIDTLFVSGSQFNLIYE
jgi:hypothetical protein